MVKRVERHDQQRIQENNNDMKRELDAAESRLRPLCVRASSIGFRYQDPQGQRTVISDADRMTLLTRQISALEMFMDTYLSQNHPDSPIFRRP